MRLFFAIEFPPDVRRAFSDYGGRLRELLPGAHFTREELIHLTLYFVGEQTPAQASALTRLLRDPGLSLPSPFALRTDRLGAFRSGGRYTLWIGLREHPNLPPLRDALLYRLTACGHPPDNRFRPHVTLAREADPDGPIGRYETRCPLPSMEIPVRSVTLFESLRQGGRLLYQPLAVREL